MPYIGNRLRTLKGSYDFAVQGGAVGAINLRGLEGIQAGAIVLGAGLDVTTVPTSGGAATIALGVETATDLQAAAAVSGAPWSTLGRKTLVPVFNFATSLKPTADRLVVATVATAALTAGKFDVYLFVIFP